jgi:phosphosulfolactate phosphohydrolase-like enzyme
VAGCRIISAETGKLQIRAGELPVLIDNLRAASTIVVALTHGVQRIIPLRPDQTPQDFDAAEVLTIGESGGKQLPGFEAGNSPALLVDILARHPRATIAMRTSNLTRILLDCERAVICSSMNVQAIAAYCAGSDTCIIAAGGSRGQAEDMGVALALAALVGGADFDPFAIACCVRESEAARHLQSLGFQADIDFIIGSGQYAVVPVYDGREIRNVETG